MAINPADPDPDPGPVSAGAVRPDHGGVRAALTSRAAGWVVATLLAGALTGLAVNVATAPSTTVVRQVSVVGSAGRSVSLPPSLAKLRGLGSCQVLAPGAWTFYPPAKGGSRPIAVPAKGGSRAIAIPAPAPRTVVGPAKRVISLPPGALVPSCGIGLVAPGARCGLIGVPRGVSISIRAAGQGRQVIIRRLTPVQVHAKAAQVKPGTQVLPPGPGPRLVCPG